MKRIKAIKLAGKSEFDWLTSNEKVKIEYKLIMKKLPCRFFFFTLQGCSLVVNGETDNILGVVVRVSFP